MSVHRGPRLRGRLPAAPPGQVWVGDDAAVLDGGLLVATDVLVEGVHFDLSWCTPTDVGWKALAVNLSDVAAMAGEPGAALVAVVTPEGRPGLADGVADGLAEAAATFGSPLVGGDTSSGPVLMVSVTVTGSVPTGEPLLRSGARPGDTVLVTGALGAAARAVSDLRAGRPADPEHARRLHRPTPRLAEATAARAAGATAMIDVSDGLTVDLGHICDESGVGARVVAAAVPIAPGASLDAALTGGDDYELCFTAADSGAVARAFGERDLPSPTVIGVVTSDRERVVAGPDGEQPLVGGWEHGVP